MSEMAYDTRQRLDGHIGSHRFIVPSTGANGLGTGFAGLGLLADLDAGLRYQFRALMVMTFTTSGGTLTYRVHPTNGLVAANFRVVVLEFCTGVVPQCDKANSLDGVASPGGVVGGGLADRYTFFEGYIDVSTAGTMAMQAALSSGAGTMAQNASYLEVTQVT